MKTWRVELTCGEQMLGEVKIKRGIFQGDTSAVCSCADSFDPHIEEVKGRIRIF